MTFQALLVIGGAIAIASIGIGPLWYGNLYIAGIGCLFNANFILLDMYYAHKDRNNCTDTSALRKRSFINMLAFGTLLFYPPSIAVLGTCLAAIAITPLAIRIGKTGAKLFNLFCSGNTNSTAHLPSKKLVNRFLEVDQYSQKHPENLGKALAILAHTQKNSPNVSFIVRNKGTHATQLIPSLNTAIKMICTQ